MLRTSASSGASPLARDDSSRTRASPTDPSVVRLERTCAPIALRKPPFLINREGEHELYHQQSPYLSDSEIQRQRSHTAQCDAQSAAAVAQDFVADAGSSGSMPVLSCVHAFWLYGPCGPALVALQWPSYEISPKAGMVP